MKKNCPSCNKKVIPYLKVPVGMPVVVSCPECGAELQGRFQESWVMCFVLFILGLVFNVMFSLPENFGFYLLGVILALQVILGLYLPLKVLRHGNNRIT